ncbi:MAG: cytochrome C [Chthonomonadales bacterium]|nr:cytochrome C [Chthonomonadales bacterium]
MAQVFSRNANTLARVSLVCLIAAPGLLVYALSTMTRSSYETKVDIPMEQPVPFSHEHHVNELGIDCRYCHTTVEKSSFAGIPPTHTCMSCHSQIWTNSPLLEPVRQSYSTGKPLQWTRVNSVPDFVFFDHSIHTNRGINCNICHGPVQQMQITAKSKTFFMSWCLNCHRNPENYVRPREDVFTLYTKFRAPESLTPEERALRLGQDYRRTPEELARGRRLLKQYGVDKDQITDCWICHR